MPVTTAAGTAALRACGQGGFRGNGASWAHVLPLDGDIREKQGRGDADPNDGFGRGTAVKAADSRYDAHF